MNTNQDISRDSKPNKPKKKTSHLQLKQNEEDVVEIYSK